MWWDSQDQDWETGVRHGAGQAVQGARGAGHCSGLQGPILLGLCPRGREEGSMGGLCLRPAWSWAVVPHGSFRETKDSL